MLNKDILKQQRLLLSCVVGGAVGVVGLFVWSHQDPPASSTLKTGETHITTAGRILNPQEIWISKIEEEDKLRDKRIDEMEKLITTLIQETEKAKANPYQSVPEPYSPGDASDSSKAKTYANQPIERRQAGVLPEVPCDMTWSSTESTLPTTEEGINAPQEERGIVSIKLSLTQGVSKDKDIKNQKRTIENTIPAGAYTRAVILGGVDASTSITSQADPRPVLIRILDEGTLPRKFKSDLKDCHVLASAHGDLSSERVFMRLEKLTCIEPLTGEIVETEVAGYVAGEDGRSGVRGRVVDRSGEAMRASFVGGFFSGMSQFFGATEQRAVYPISPFGQTNAMPVQTMLTTGASLGTGNALDKYAEFYIKRAEQLQPVIQVAAGRHVTIVFTQGTQMGDTSVKQTLHKIRENSRKDIVTNLETKPDGKQWLPQPQNQREGD